MLGGSGDAVEVGGGGDLPVLGRLLSPVMWKLCELFRAEVIGMVCGPSVSWWCVGNRKDMQSGRCCWRGNLDPMALENAQLECSTDYISLGRILRTRASW